MLCASSQKINKGSHKLWCILLKVLILCIFRYLIRDELSVDTCVHIFFFKKRLNLIYYSNLFHTLEAKMNISTIFLV